MGPKENRPWTWKQYLLEERRRREQEWNDAIARAERTGVPVWGFGASAEAKAAKRARQRAQEQTNNPPHNPFGPPPPLPFFGPANRTEPAEEPEPQNEPGTSSTQPGSSSTQPGSSSTQPDYRFQPEESMVAKTEEEEAKKEREEWEEWEREEAHIPILCAV